jgi:DNA processing protein
MENWFGWLALSFVPGVGRVTYKRLISQFGLPGLVFGAPFEELKKHINEKTARAIKDFDQTDRVEDELSSIEKFQVTLVTLKDENYPKNLAQIYDPPPFLYVKGELKEKDERSIAIVGSRRATHYGRSVTERISSDLAKRGITIVSGMARGIDSSAHKGALSVRGRTIAVMGCGVNVIYPPENSGLYHQIASSGAVISELPMSTPPDGSNFPARNRIISGFSRGTTIIEASSRSGSLITAKLALEQGREVFAVPGMIDSATSKGTHRLIKEGAKLVENTSDILEEILPQYSSLDDLSRDRQGSKQFLDISPEAKSILKFLDKEPIHIDTIIKKSGLDAGLVSSLLLDLELKDMVKQLPGKMFIGKF